MLTRFHLKSDYRSNFIVRIATEISKGEIILTLIAPVTNVLATVLIFAGVLFYVPFVWLGWTLPLGLYQRFEIIIQQYFEVVPVQDDKAK